jgi:hypothetical protein
VTIDVAPVVINSAINIPRGIVLAGWCQAQPWVISRRPPVVTRPVVMRPVVVAAVVMRPVVIAAVVMRPVVVAAVVMRPVVVAAVVMRPVVVAAVVMRPVVIVPFSVSQASPAVVPSGIFLTGWCRARTRVIANPWFIVSRPPVVIRAVAIRAVFLGPVAVRAVVQTVVIGAVILGSVAVRTVAVRTVAVRTVVVRTVAVRALFVRPLFKLPVPHAASAVIPPGIVATRRSRPRTWSWRRRARPRVVVLIVPDPSPPGILLTRGTRPRPPIAIVGPWMAPDEAPAEGPLVVRPPGIAARTLVVVIVGVLRHRCTTSRDLVPAPLAAGGVLGLGPPPPVVLVPARPFTGRVFP